MIKYERIDISEGIDVKKKKKKIQMNVCFAIIGFF